MRRGLLLLLTWLAGTIVAIALAWGAVSVFRRNVTDHRVAPLSARAVSEALGTPDVGETTPSLASSTTVPPDDSSTTAAGVTTASTGSGRATTTTRKSPTGRSTSTTSLSGANGSATGTGSSGTSSNGSGPQAGGGTPTTTRSGSSPVSQTDGTTSPQYSGERVVDDGNGNQVDIRCQGQTVSYGWITPASGWSRQVVTNGPADLIVRFEHSNPSSESRLEASCDAAGHPTFTWKH